MHAECRLLLRHVLAWTRRSRALPGRRDLRVGRRDLPRRRRLLRRTPQLRAGRHGAEALPNAGCCVRRCGRNVRTRSRVLRRTLRASGRSFRLHGVMLQRRDCLHVRGRLLQRDLRVRSPRVEPRLRSAASMRSGCLILAAPRYSSRDGMRARKRRRGQWIWMLSMGPVRGRAVLVGLAGLCACARAGDGTNFRFPTDDGGLAGEVGSGDVGSSGSPESSSGSSGSSSGANSGGSGSTDADAVASSGGGVACGPSCMGCCDARGMCVAGLGDTACGAAGARCQDCTAIGTTCQAGGACTLGSSTGSSSGASSGSSSGASSEGGAGCRTGTSSSSCGRGTCAGCCDQAGNCHPGTSNSNCGSRSNCCVDCNAANKTCNAGTCS